MEYILVINGYGCFPSKYEVQLSDVDREDGSGRNQNGDMLRDRAGGQEESYLDLCCYSTVKGRTPVESR